MISKELLDNFNRFLSLSKVYSPYIEAIPVKCPDCGREKVRLTKLEEEPRQNETGLTWKITGDCGHKWKFEFFYMSNGASRAEVTSKTKSFIIAGNFLNPNENEACTERGRG